MARKNGMKNDSTTITFNPRTKAVMADVVQDNIKEKVNSVREVVTGKSNNEIILVLQYYDYDVEKTIHAYMEDGAKMALTEWHYSGSKPVKKKRNKKKTSSKPQTDVPQSPESVSSESGSTASCMTNGDTPILNGVLDIDTNGTGLPNGHAPPVLPPDPRNSNHSNSNITTNSSVIESGTRSNITVTKQPNPPITKQQESTVTRQPEASDSKQSITLNGTKEKSPSPQPQRSHGQGQRQRTHSGHNHGHQGHTNHQGHGQGHGEGRHRTTSTNSTSSIDGGTSGKKHAHVLERSAKDLHRQTVSLERLRLVFNEEVDKNCKRIKTVFEEMRQCLNLRETQIMSELATTKETGITTFIMRQGLAAGLKVQIDRSERMNDTELAELRSDIKHFVSDRKVDEDLGRTTRFLYDDDQFKRDISKFGEVVPVKCGYIPAGHSVPVVTSNTSPVVTEPVPSIDTTRIQSTGPGDKKEPSTSETIPHLDPNQAHEMAELQKRLKHSLTLEGIPVETFPDRPSTAPVPTTSTQTNNDRPQSANTRNNNNNRRRPNGDRDRRDRPRQDNRGQGQRSTDEGQRSTGYRQESGGERVILIGRGTRSQNGASSRPPRGGARGRGNYGRDRGGTRNDNTGNHGNTSTEVTGQSGAGLQGDAGSSQGQRSSPAKEQRPPRGNSGSPRRGGNRGNRGGNYRGRGGSQGNTSINSSPTDKIQAQVFVNSSSKEEQS